MSVNVQLKKLVKMNLGSHLYTINNPKFFLFHNLLEAVNWFIQEGLA